jgi:hypothetical protein
MTIEAPDFDPELTGYSAVVINREDGPICHALVSRYPQGEPEQQTECGIKVPQKSRLDTDNIAPRKEFIEEGEPRMCLDCWPSSVIDS